MYSIIIDLLLQIAYVYVFCQTNVMFLACPFPVGEGGASHTAYYAECGNCRLKNGGNHPVVFFGGYTHATGSNMERPSQGPSINSVSMNIRNCLLV